MKQKTEEEKIEIERQRKGTYKAFIAAFCFASIAVMIILGSIISIGSVIWLFISK